MRFFLWWASLLGAGQEKDYIVYWHRVPSGEPQELVPYIHAGLYTSLSRNRESMVVLVSSLFFLFCLLRSKEGRERDYSISLILFPCIQRRSVSSFKMWEEVMYIPLSIHGRVEILPDGRSVIHRVENFELTYENIVWLGICDCPGEVVNSGKSGRALRLWQWDRTRSPSAEGKIAIKEWEEV